MQPINPLVTFYNNEHEREAVKAFLMEQLGSLAIERAFDGDDVVGIKEARDTIVRSFNKLDEMYGKIKTAPEQNSR